MIKDFLLGCIAITFFIIMLSLFEGWIFMLLWNWLTPLFWSSAPILTVWQSVGILLLVNIIGRLIFGEKS